MLLYLYMNYYTLANKTIIESHHLDERIYNFLDTTFVIPDEFDFDIVKVTEDYIARPDLIAIEAYGDSDFTDIICKLNGIGNPFELNEGDLLVIPTFDTIRYFMNQPDIDDLEVDDKNNNTPRVKTKTEKRKANEAVLGDKRFRIDPSRRIIIY